MKKPDGIGKRSHRIARKFGVGAAGLVVRKEGGFQRALWGVRRNKNENWDVSGSKANGNRKSNQRIRGLGEIDLIVEEIGGEGLDASWALSGVGSTQKTQNRSPNWARRRGGEGTVGKFRF